MFLSLSELAFSPNPPPARPNFIGRYEIREKLKQGSVAAIYRADDPRAGREVVIKILPAELLDQSVLRARFEREAQIIATLEHPAIDFAPIWQPLPAR